MENQIFRITELQKIYNPKKNPFEALRGVTFNVKNGETLAIVGKSGSGKSTLMHLMAGLDKPSSGSIEFDGKNLEDLKKTQLAEVRNKSFGFIFQQFYLMPRFNVLENVALQLQIRGISSSERKNKAEQALEQVGILDKAKNKATDLSGGQKQRVAIARALVADPDVIFADEPTGNLDSKTGETIENLLFELNKDLSKTVIVVTHDHDLADKCNRKIELKDGKIIN